MWGLYEKRSKGRRSPSIAGGVFEYILCETLAREGVLPFYCQTRFSLVPNSDFDIVCYDPRRPAVLSAKVSLRERCKQADLKGMVLRQVYRSEESCLITLNAGESRAVQSKIESGDVAGLTRCVLADSPDYNALLAELKTRTFSPSEAIEPLGERDSGGGRVAVSGRVGVRLKWTIAAPSFPISTALSPPFPPSFSRSPPSFSRFQRHSRESGNPEGGKRRWGAPRLLKARRLAGAGCAWERGRPARRVALARGAPSP